MKVKSTFLMVPLMAVMILAQAGYSWADDDNAEPPKPIAPIQKDNMVPCFVPGGTAAPEDYLKHQLKGFGAINALFHEELVKGSDAGKFLMGGIFDMKLECEFQEPALQAAERAKQKETATNKDNTWKLPQGAQAWADIKPQYVFYLKAQSFDEHCDNATGLQFHVRYTKAGKETSVDPMAVCWKRGKADGTNIGGGGTNTAIGGGFSIGFHPSSTLYKNELVLYSGVPLSEKVSKITVEAMNCFGQSMLFAYHLRYGQVPKYVESRDSFSGKYESKLVWPE
ncbi:MAG TPA: hypothetical protein VMV05_06525 [bacterium]|nr:hypothetical protein [bacterium]